MKKIILVLTCFVCIFACANSAKNGESGDMSGADGKKVYKTNCMLCHGSDGKLGANGSKDLTASALSLDERIAIITEGKGAMASYKTLLSKEEIEAVAKYTLSLK